MHVQVFKSSLQIFPYLGCVNQAGYLNRIICWNKVWDARCYRAEKFHLSDHWLSWILKNEGGKKKSTAEYPRLITLVEHSEAYEQINICT